MTSTATFAPACNDSDLADQHIFAHDSRGVAGLDPATLASFPETLRPAIETAALTDRIDQAWITPLDCDDDYDRDHTDIG